MKIMVTGGAGFIGSHLVDRMIQEGHDVVVVDNLSTGKKSNLNPKAHFYKEDITSSKIEKIMKKERPDLISHHAAQMDVRVSVENPKFDAESNIIGTINILENAVKHGVKKVVFASSGGAIYGEQSIFPADESHSNNPLSPYGIAKKSGELYLYFYKEVYGLSYAAMRYANVYGPRQDPHGEAGVVAIFSGKIINDEQVVINGNGMQTRDYVFVHDVVDANMAVINGKHDGIYNVGTSIETSVNNLYAMMSKASGSPQNMVHGPAMKGEQKRSCLDYKKLNDTSGWEPGVMLDEGLKMTIDFFREQQK